MLREAGESLKEFISLKIDYAFKLIFGKEGNEAILIAFLNAALKLPQESRIEEITIINPELNKEYPEDKKSILDVRAITSQGMQINIEIQLSNQYDMEKRSLYYWAQMYSRQIREGMAYKELTKTVSINIVDFNYLKQTSNYHNVFHLYEDEEKFQLTDVLEIHFMELPKLLAKWRRREISLWENELVRWLLLLEGADNQEILQILEEIAMKDPVLYQAMNAWEETSEDPRIREAYFDRRKAILDEKAAIREAELRLQEALEEGMAKGIAEGRAKGIAEGKAEGKAEGRAEGRAEVAKKLLVLGFEITKIAEATGLSEEEISGLKD
ncbi:MAG: Rpn family recombination-promoting nuclease/putative transposase [Desulfitobacterium hafniense]|uniref:Rpn family recombination-promoting nuclease/putative transposase n=1 Tax=Desulfitobacterium hafniense TaxID=49338 RepID=UPI002B21EA51|nr:Rpn family recombination-promoting nuclease/putative transposase [Desulfitobacterium hafniense]MEA5021576.1 Rpn family recombination-promoting nuclease/putative transposase [Desulfitobacterium hafniense]